MSKSPLGNQYTCAIHKGPIYTLIKRLGKNGPFVCLDCWKVRKK